VILFSYKHFFLICSCFGSYLLLHILSYGLTVNVFIFSIVPRCYNFLPFFGVEKLESQFQKIALIVDVAPD